MLKNYLIVGFRNLFRDPLYSFINIIGLAVWLHALKVARANPIDALRHE